MFRIIQTAVVLAITLILVNESQAGRPGTSSGSMTKTPVHGPGSSHDPRGPNQTHGRDYRNWDHHYWNSRYRCDYFWSGSDRCYFYFYAPANCYYPITAIELFPPVVVPVTPVVIVPNGSSGRPRRCRLGRRRAEPLSGKETNDEQGVRTLWILTPFRFPTPKRRRLNVPSLPFSPLAILIKTQLPLFSTTRANRSIINTFCV